MGATTSANPIGKGLFEFLEELAEHNTRAWFQDNKDRYEAHVKAPALQLIAQFAPHLHSISRQFEAIPKATGGSLFRIHRDTRFGLDKTPYKTHVGIRFMHRERRDVHAPGFYLHLDPKESFVGVGVWHPEPATLLAVRTYIVEHARAWQRARDDGRFQGRFQIGGETLKRAPKGFDSDHPLIEDLKRKEYTAFVRLTRRQILAPGFLPTLADHYRDAAPFVRFLCKAIGVAF